MEAAVRERIEKECEILRGDIAKLQHDLILATGALQAMLYLLSDEAPQASADVVQFPSADPAPEPEEPGYGSGV